MESQLSDAADTQGRTLGCEDKKLQVAPEEGGLAGRTAMISETT